MEKIVGLLVLVVGMAAGTWFPALFPQMDSTISGIIALVIAAALGWIAGDIMFGK